MSDLAQTHASAARGARVGLGWRHRHYQELLAQRPTIDFLEVHSENFFGAGGAALSILRRAREHYPISLHGVGLSLGSVAGVDAWHLDQLAHLVQVIGPIRISDHACFARANLNGRTVHAADLLPIAFTNEALDVLCANVQVVQHRLKRTIAVENLSAYVSWPQQPGEYAWPEHNFLNELARRTGCQLLVDVNNLFVNACNDKLTNPAVDPVSDCCAWLDAIAPAAVAELHLAGHCHVNDEHGEIFIDDHGSAVCDAVWTIYQHALARFGPVDSLIEWDTDVPALGELLAQADMAREMRPVFWPVLRPDGAGA